MWFKKSNGSYYGHYGPYKEENPSGSASDYNRKKRYYIALAVIIFLLILIALMCYTCNGHSSSRQQAPTTSQFEQLRTIESAIEDASPDNVVPKQKNRKRRKSRKKKEAAISKAAATKSKEKIRKKQKVDLGTKIEIVLPEE